LRWRIELPEIGRFLASSLCLRHAPSRFCCGLLRSSQCLSLLF
jgi:hypothetical protein